jgi:pimeloyl-ACP methyl ester carboxylesterase
MLDLNERFSYQGQSIAWGAMGEGDPIVLIHGFPWSAQAWRSIAPWLAKTHKVYYFDMLGTGLSEKGPNQNVTESGAAPLKWSTHWDSIYPIEGGSEYGRQAR